MTSLIFSSGLAVVWAQPSSDGSVEIPSGALLKPVPDFSQYTITFENPKASDPTAAANAINQIIVTKTGNITSEVTIHQNGAREEVWHVGSSQYQKSGNDPVWYGSSPAGDGNKTNNGYSPMPAIGYRDWDWVNRETFLGTMALDGGSCLVFGPVNAAKPKAGSGMTKDQLAALPLMALVNAETRLPMALGGNGHNQRYIFAPPPTAMQQLPPDLAEQLKKAEDVLRRVTQPAPRPF